MKTLLIAALLSAVTFTATAKSFKDWYVTVAGDKATDALYDENTKAVLTTSDAGNPFIYFAVPRDMCFGYDEEFEDASPATINGTVVRMLSKCISEGVMAFTPKTSKGDDYVINEFKVKRYVTVDGILFSAQGFRKIYHYEVNQGI